MTHRYNSCLKVLISNIQSQHQGRGSAALKFSVSEVSTTSRNKGECRKKNKPEHH